MPMIEGYDYDEFQVYVTMPYERLDKEPNLLDTVIQAGMVALGMEPDTTMEINWVDSHYN